MTVRLAGTEAHLEGDWTMTGVAENLESLVDSLNRIEAVGEKQLLINCRQIHETDTSGLQLLNVWVECARLRGIKPKFVHVTDGMHQAISKLGFSSSFSDSYSDRRCSKR